MCLRIVQVDGMFEIPYKFVQIIVKKVENFQKNPEKVEQFYDNFCTNTVTVWSEKEERQRGNTNTAKKYNKN